LLKQQVMQKHEIVTLLEISMNCAKQRNPESREDPTMA
jgi:hypothetical protein